MLKWLHDHLFGHVYERTADASTLNFRCRCGDEWWPGFTLKALTQRDHFAPYRGHP